MSSRALDLYYLNRAAEVIRRKKAMISMEELAGKANISTYKVAFALSQRQLEILTAGGLINYIRRTKQSTMHERKDRIMDDKNEQASECSMNETDAQGHSNLCCCYVINEDGEYDDPCSNRSTIVAAVAKD